MSGTVSIQYYKYIYIFLVVVCLYRPPPSILLPCCHFFLPPFNNYYSFAFPYFWLLYYRKILRRKTDYQHVMGKET